MAVLATKNALAGNVGDTFNGKVVKRVIRDGVYVFGSQEDVSKDVQVGTVADAAGITALNPSDYQQGDRLFDSSDGYEWVMKPGTTDASDPNNWAKDTSKPRTYADNAARLARTGFTPEPGESFTVGTGTTRAHYQAENVDPPAAANDAAVGPAATQEGTLAELATATELAVRDWSPKTLEDRHIVRTSCPDFDVSATPVLGQERKVPSTATATQASPYVVNVSGITAADNDKQFMVSLGVGQYADIGGTIYSNVGPNTDSLRFKVVGGAPVRIGNATGKATRFLDQIEITVVGNGTSGTSQVHSQVINDKDGTPYSASDWQVVSWTGTNPYTNGSFTNWRVAGNATGVATLKWVGTGQPNGFSNITGTAVLAAIRDVRIKYLDTIGDDTGTLGTMTPPAEFYVITSDAAPTPDVYTNGETGASNQLRVLTVPAGYEALAGGNPVAADGDRINVLVNADPATSITNAAEFQAALGTGILFAGDSLRGSDAPAPIWMDATTPAFPSFLIPNYKAGQVQRYHVEDGAVGRTLTVSTSQAYLDVSDYTKVVPAPALPVPLDDASTYDFWYEFTDNTETAWNIFYRKVHTTKPDNGTYTGLQVVGEFSFGERDLTSGTNTTLTTNIDLTKCDILELTLSDNNSNHKQIVHAPARDIPGGSSTNDLMWHWYDNIYFRGTVVDEATGQIRFTAVNGNLSLIHLRGLAYATNGFVVPLGYQVAAPRTISVTGGAGTIEGSATATALEGVAKTLRIDLNAGKRIATIAIDSGEVIVSDADQGLVIVTAGAADATITITEADSATYTGYQPRTFTPSTPPPIAGGSRTSIDLGFDWSTASKIVFTFRDPAGMGEWSYEMTLDVQELIANDKFLMHRHDTNYIRAHVNGGDPTNGIIDLQVVAYTGNPTLRKAVVIFDAANGYVVPTATLTKNQIDVSVSGGSTTISGSATARVLEGSGAVNLIVDLPAGQEINAGPTVAALPAGVTMVVRDARQGLIAIEVADGTGNVTLPITTQAATAVVVCGAGSNDTAARSFSPLGGSGNTMNWLASEVVTHGGVIYDENAGTWLLPEGTWELLNSFTTSQHDAAGEFGIFEWTDAAATKLDLAYTTNGVQVIQHNDGLVSNVLLGHSANPITSAIVSVPAGQTLTVRPTMVQVSGAFGWQPRRSLTSIKKLG